MEWRLFADIAERAGTRRVPIDPTDVTTIEDALDELFDTHPELRDRMLTDDKLVDHLTILHNGNPVGDDGLTTPVGADDELAVFPPVSGG